MKTKKTAIVILVTIMSVVSCSNKRDSLESNSTHETMIQIGSEFAQIHNECLEDIYHDIKRDSIGYGNRNSVENSFLSSANRFINNRSIKSRTDIAFFELEASYFKKSIEDIESSISIHEKNYIYACLKLDKNEPIEPLLLEISLDKEIDNTNKQAVICFITTLKASREYWDEHANEWSLMLNMPSSRAELGTVAVTDAWWGFQGMLSSGLNPIVGGGTAAVASALAFIYSK